MTPFQAIHLTFRRTENIGCYTFDGIKVDERMGGIGCKHINTD